MECSSAPFIRLKNLQLSQSNSTVCEAEKFRKIEEMGVAQQRDCRNWEEDSYRDAILQERETLSRTVFRTAYAPNPNPNPNSDYVVTASSDGSVAAYSISACLVIRLFLSKCLVFVTHTTKLYSKRFLVMQEMGCGSSRNRK